MPLDIVFTMCTFADCADNAVVVAAMRAFNDVWAGLLGFDFALDFACFLIFDFVFKVAHFFFVARFSFFFLFEFFLVVIDFLFLLCPLRLFAFGDFLFEESGGAQGVRGEVGDFAKDNRKNKDDDTNNDG